MTDINFDVDAATAPKKIGRRGRGENELPLQAYLRSVKLHKLLTPEEEKTLTAHYKETKDVRTEARLVSSNLLFVVRVAFGYRHAIKNVMDLIQEGNVGLLVAVRRFDPERGVKLCSYAAWWVRAFMLKFLMDNKRLVRLGTTQVQRKLFFRLGKAKAYLSTMGEDPTTAQLAEFLNVDEQAVVDMDQRLAGTEGSLDAPVGDSDGRTVSQLDLMPSPTTTPDVAFEEHHDGEFLRDHMVSFRATLRGKNVAIFDKRLLADEPLSLQELGDEFGVSRERIRQLESKLVTKLRAYVKEELGDSMASAMS